MSTSELVRRARLDAGLTQRQLAARAGTSQPALARYERGETIPSIPTLERLLRACGRGLSLAAVSGGDTQPTSLRACSGPRARLLRRNRRELLRLLRRGGARNVRVFGSVARGDETATSDVDLLVELGPDATLLDLARLRREAADLLGVRVDVVTAKTLRDSIRERAEREAIPV